MPKAKDIKPITSNIIISTKFDFFISFPLPPRVVD